MTEGTLNLLHLRPDPRRLAAWAAQHRLLVDQGDLGYALHGLLRAAFGDAAPQPFRYLSADQGLLAYSAVPELLRERAARADDEVAGALGLLPSGAGPGMACRPFPEHWPQGHVLAFDLRVRPVVRRGKDGAERDAFLAAVERAQGEPVDREAVYRDWVNEQFGRSGGAAMEGASVAGWRLLNVMRQTQRKTGEDSRRRRTVCGPDVQICGLLRVADPEAFASLLRRGVGRHRAFGFGMLLLRPAAG